MQIRAKLNQNSHLWREWRGAGKPVGVLMDVQFRWYHGHGYLSGDLTADQTAALKDHPWVTLEIAAIHGAHKPPSAEAPSPPPPPPEEPPEEEAEDDEPPAPPVRVDPLAGELPQRGGRSNGGRVKRR